MPNQFQLHFHPSLRSKILSGAKTATTRLRGEDDPNSTLEALRAALARGPQRCAAITDDGTFAELDVQRARSLKFEEVDDELARLEDCETAADLRALVRRFYPDVADDALFDVFHFTVAPPRGIPWALAGVERRECFFTRQYHLFARQHPW